MKIKYSEIRKGDPFGKKLENLGIKNNYKSAAAIADALYNNDLCFSLALPRKKGVKHNTDVKKDKAAIARNVQRHIEPNKEVTEISSNYLLAYSILFECSLDYLYGKIDEPYPDLEIADISKKTGLSSKAITNLSRKSEIYLESFLYPYYEYEFLYSNIDAEAYTDTTKFWNDILESDIFFKLPESWTEMACALCFYKATNQQFLERDTKKIELPSREEFYNRVDEYYATHDHDPCLGEDPYKIYDNDQERVLRITRDIDYEEWNESATDSSKAKTVYWGCAGMFDRLVSNYFHDLADKFEIPTYDIDDDSL